MGSLMRRYWLPALLSRELPGNDCPPVRMKILGEELLAFRDTNGKIGIVDAYCPHRRAPMYYGRNEECGIRCVYHGWKFDVAGRCVDLPSVAESEKIKQKVRIKSYPTVERADVVWIYMGPSEKMPDEPDFEWMRAPATHRHVSKNYQANNYLQALEGGLDTSHSSFLHNQTVGNDNTVRNLDRAPRLEVFPTDYGYSYVSFRKFDENNNYIRVYQFIAPMQQLRGDMIDDGGIRKSVPKIDGHFWVPIDDEQTMTWSFMYGAESNVPITPEFAENDEKRAGRGVDDFLPGTFKLKRNPSNDHMLSRELQKTTFTGIVGIGTQDIGIQEGMGPIVDRSKELLVGSDAAIIGMRRILLEATRAVERGEDPPALNSATSRKVRAHDGIVPNNTDWREALAAELQPRW
jgi:phenylpropionate dioxygenase-like ring-hydroxylating dioxygenase large terminal subunit